MNENEDDKTTKAEIIPAKQKALSRLQEIEEDLHHESFEVVSAVVNFAEIDRDAEEPPQEWISNLGYARAIKRFRLAKSGWMGAKEAPIGIKVAATIAGNIIKAKGAEGQRQPLNINLVKITNTIPDYATQEIEE